MTKACSGCAGAMRGMVDKKREWKEKDKKENIKIIRIFGHFKQPKESFYHTFCQPYHLERKRNGMAHDSLKPSSSSEELEEHVTPWPAPNDQSATGASCV